MYLALIVKSKGPQFLFVYVHLIQVPKQIKLNFNITLSGRWTHMEFWL